MSLNDRSWFTNIYVPDVRKGEVLESEEDMLHYRLTRENADWRFANQTEGFLRPSPSLDTAVSVATTRPTRVRRFEGFHHTDLCSVPTLRIGTIDTAPVAGDERTTRTAIAAVLEHVVMRTTFGAILLLTPEPFLTLGHDLNVIDYIL